VGRFVGQQLSFLRDNLVEWRREIEQRVNLLEEIVVMWNLA
jgi:hypothetical protein